MVTKMQMVECVLHLLLAKYIAKNRKQCKDQNKVLIKFLFWITNRNETVSCKAILFTMAYIINKTSSKNVS